MRCFNLSKRILFSIQATVHLEKRKSRALILFTPVPARYLLNLKCKGIAGRYLRLLESYGMLHAVNL